MEHKSAIVLAMFGTAVESGLPGLLHIRERMVRAWPQTPVRIAFTSNIIRRIWRQRAQDRQYTQNHPEVPAAVLEVQGPLAAVANLLDAEYDGVVVQPVQIAPAGEFFALAATVEGLNSMDRKVRRQAVAQPGAWPAGPGDIRCRLSLCCRCPHRGRGPGRRRPAGRRGRRGALVYGTRQ
ncbi:MAG: hypothetical protein GXP57_01885 [Deltaproteobacteria bacterium]|nr:hypothetical protein [Deltaproteobacteria bacterium]